MHSDLKLRPLSALALLCRSATGLPFWLMMLALRTEDAAAQAECCAVLAAGGFLLMLLRRFFLRKYTAMKAFWLTVPVLLLIFAVCTALMLRQVPGAYAVIGILPAVTLPALLKGAERGPAGLFSVSHLTAFLTGAALSVAVQSLTKLPVSGQLLVAVTASVCALWLLLRNQLMLERLVRRRADAGGEVPADIRKSNLTMVTVTVLALLPVFLFRSQIYSGITMFADSAVSLMRWLWRGFLKAVLWLSGEDESLDLPDESQSPGEVPYRETGNPLWSLLLLLLIPFVIVIWKNFISDWLFDLREAIERFINKLRENRRSAEPAAAADSGEYTDTETDIRPENAARRRRRSWIRTLRAWQRLPDSGEKFYAGYALMLEAPAWESEPPRPAETSAEIRQRWQEQHEDIFGKVTEDLHADRYAQTGLPESAVSDAADALGRLRREKRK
ncbi:MAG: hypothetical protein J6Z45_02105 [Oscillospiraceae bacterium]|nr:hypothetical protein [Oscillospiraceae bacterium]